MKTWYQIAGLLFLGLVFETYTIFGVTPQGTQTQRSQSTNTSSVTIATNSNGPIQFEVVPSSPAETRPDSSKEAPEKTISEAAGAQKPEAEQESTPEPSVSRPSTSAPSAGFETRKNIEKSSAELQSEEAQAGANRTREIQESAGAESLIEKIRTNLNQDPTTSTADVNVSIENGKIVLKGAVNSETERQQIQRRVEAAIIDNQLEIAPSDNQLNPNK